MICATDCIEKIDSQVFSRNLTLYKLLFLFQDGYTALTAAAKDGHIDIVYKLLQKGTYVNLPDRVRIDCHLHIGTR